MPTIDWPPPRRPRQGGGAWLLALVALVLLGGGAALSYYVDALWFDSLGFAAVFWKTLNFQGSVFAAFFALTFLVLYGAFLGLKPARLADLTSPILINGQPFRLPVEPVLRLIGGGVALAIAVLTGLGMMGEWNTFALYWHGAPSTAGTTVDPIFGRDVSFYLFTLPAWQLLAGWATSLAFLIAITAVFFAVLSGGSRLISRQAPTSSSSARGISLAGAALLAMLAVDVYLGRFERLFAGHTIFSGVTYTEAAIGIPGMLIVAAALLLGAIVLVVNAVAVPKILWIVASIVPALIAYAGVSVTSWYVNAFIVKPNELVRETPYIAHNIAATRAAYGLTAIEEVAFPAEPGLAAVDAPNNQETLENIRLWEWRALQDTLRQIQEIRTYYDFPDIDIDRYELDGAVRQVMLAVRELNIERLPESSRNWINERLVYTHGYGITMNRVNGFTPEGLPDLLLGNMPVESKVPSLQVTRPEIYFGELTNSDVYVRTGQKEFNYPQGDTNSMASYEGEGGMQIGGFLRRILIAINRGDLAKLPFSDDVTSESRLLMRRNIRDRADAVAPFLTFDPDPYIVVTRAGRLVWMLDGFTTSDRYPYARAYRLHDRRVNYLRNSVKMTIDAYDGAVALYVFDEADPVVAAYRRMFPTLFRNAADMPDDLRSHIRYPEMLLDVQAAVYGLYHMTAPAVFYNRDDLWTVASEVGMSDRREQAVQTMEPNFVLMKLPGEDALEFVEILPFTPANRNNLIGWMAARSDGEHYGKAIVYDFPKARLVDGPLQIEARIDQNAQLSGQLSLWNQQGSRVRRGGLIVIPVGRALLYAEPIYLQADRSPMPELRIVVLALQDRFAYGPTFEAAMASLFGNQPSSLTPAVAPVANDAPSPSRAGATPAAPATADETNALINDAARDLTEYQRLTAEGRLAEAGQRLQALKEKLERLAARSR